MNGRSGVEDFTLHFAIQDACNNLNAESLNGRDTIRGDRIWRLDFVGQTRIRIPARREQVATSKLLGVCVVVEYCVQRGAGLRQGLRLFGGLAGRVWGCSRGFDNLVYINRTFAYGGTVTAGSMAR